MKQVAGWAVLFIGCLAFAILVDHGKTHLGVPDYILQKPSRLTDREFQEITAHASIGAGIVSAMEFPEPVDDVVLSHHEHWDGSGYPRGLRGEEIPLLGRIVAIADVFDALSSRRCYKAPWEESRSIEIISQGAGTQFDPELVEIFVNRLAFIRIIQDRYAEPEAEDEAN